MLHAPWSMSHDPSLSGCICPSERPSKVNQSMISQSDTSVQRQEVDIQQEDGVYEERFLGLKLITDEQRGSAVCCPEHTAQLEDSKQTTSIKSPFRTPGLYNQTNNTLYVALMIIITLS